MLGATTTGGPCGTRAQSGLGRLADVRARAGRLETGSRLACRNHFVCNGAQIFNYFELRHPEQSRERPILAPARTPQASAAI